MHDGYVPRRCRVTYMDFCLNGSTVDDDNFSACKGVFVKRVGNLVPFTVISVRTHAFCRLTW